jgi:uncharacterized protein HemY
LYHHFNYYYIVVIVTLFVLVFLLAVVLLLLLFLLRLLLSVGCHVGAWRAVKGGQPAWPANNNTANNKNNKTPTQFESAEALVRTTR